MLILFDKERMDAFRKQLKEAVKNAMGHSVWHDLVGLERELESLNCLVYCLKKPASIPTFIKLTEVVDTGLYPLDVRVNAIIGVSSRETYSIIHLPSRGALCVKESNEEIYKLIARSLLP